MPPPKQAQKEGSFVIFSPLTMDAYLAYQHRRQLLLQYGIDRGENASQLLLQYGIDRGVDVRDHGYSGLSSAHSRARADISGSLSSRKHNARSAAKRPALTKSEIIEEAKRLHALYRAEQRKRRDRSPINQQNKKKKKMQEHTINGWLNQQEIAVEEWEKEESAVNKEESAVNAWANFSDTKTLPMSTEEEEAQISSKIHRKVAEDVGEFIGSFSDEEFSDEEYLTDLEDDYAATVSVIPSSPCVKSREDQAFDFFTDLFKNNEDLSRLYAEQCNAGKFECLVCSSIPGKPIKQFNGLVSLVMHASKIQRTKKRPEHRGLGRAVCMLLGWDPMKNPTVPIDKSLRPRGCVPPGDAAVSTQETGFIDEAQKQTGCINHDNNDDIDRDNRNSSEEEDELQNDESDSHEDTVGDSRNSSEEEDGVENELETDEDSRNSSDEEDGVENEDDTDSSDKQQ